MEASGPNAEQIRHWNKVAGAKWIAMQEQLDLQIAPFSQEAMDRLAVAPGERALDVGCGCGGTTLELAHRVGASGHATGVDISTPMLERARAHASEQQVRNAEFVEADAQTFEFKPAQFDLLFSRFGVMFFDDPVAAFTNLRRALTPGGRLAFVCWQAIDRNPWMLVPAGAVSAHIELKRPPPGAPGPFAFADRDRVRSILEQAGFLDVQFESIERTFVLGGLADLDAATDFAMQFGAAAAALRDAPQETHTLVRGAIRKALAPFHTSEGVRMGAASWFVRALPGKNS